jgi:hypothetical protein
MRTYNSQQIARPEWWDRNPITNSIQYVATGVAPHGATQRASYTVPAGKKAYVDMVLLTVRRDLAAGAAALAAAYATYTPSGGTETRLFQQGDFQNTVNAGQQATITQFGFLGVGDAVKLYTLDASTGGTYTYLIGAKITEYDA